MQPVEIEPDDREEGLIAEERGDGAAEGGSPQSDQDTNRHEKKKQKTRPDPMLAKRKSKKHMSSG